MPFCLRRLVQFCSPLHTIANFYSAKMHFALSSLGHLIWQWRNVLHYYLVGFVGPKSFWYSVVTLKRAGQREGPQWSCHTILLIVCTVSHMLLLKRKSDCSYLSVIVAFVFAFLGMKCYVGVIGPLYWSMMYRLDVLTTLVLTTSLVRNTEIQGCIQATVGY